VTNHAAKWACCAAHLDADLRLGQRDLGGLTAQFPNRQLTDRGPGAQPEPA